MKKKEKLISTKSKTENTEETTIHGSQGKANSSTTRNCYIKCFKCQGRGHVASQCLNKRVMIVRVNGQITYDSEDETESMAPLEECFNFEVQEPVHGDLLVTRRALSIQRKGDGDEEQREHIFHTRYNVKVKVCTSIIDSGSCTNVASSLMVEKLNLHTMKHPKLYKLQ